MKSFLLALIITFSFGLSLFAQTKKTLPEAVAKPLNLNVAEAALPALLAGDATIDVGQKASLTLNVGLAAQGGVTLFHYNSRDKLRAIHPGSDCLSIEAPKEDEPIIFRWGPSFVPQNQNTPGAIVIVEMASGLVCTLAFYPVQDLRQNTNRLYLRYAPQVICQAKNEPGFDPKSCALDYSDKPAPKEPEQAAPVKVVPQIQVLNAEITATGLLKPCADLKCDQQILQDAIKAASMGKNLSWTNGKEFSLGLSKPFVHLNGRCLIAVVLKNTSQQELTLTEPEVLSLKSSNSGASQSELIAKTIVGNFVKDGKLNPRETGFYLLEFKPPLLEPLPKLIISVQPKKQE